MKLTNKALAALVVAFTIASTPSLALAGDWTDRSVHDSGELNTYKRPNQRSFTGPFDYSPINTVHREPAAPQPAAGRCNKFTFDATKSYDIDKHKLSVMWDFGDGTTSDQPVVTHVFEKAGDYNVNLTVKDNSGQDCDTGVTSTKVSVNFPPVCMAGEPKRSCVGETVSFTADGSSASGPASYKWDFGDGTTGEGMQVTHAYDKAGSYRVFLMIDDGKGTECSTASCGTSVVVTERTSVDLTGPESTCTGRTVSFNAAGTGARNYRWDFGDGMTAEGGSKVSHAYSKGGTYTVSVTADSGDGSACAIAADSQSIKVSSTPIADAGENVVCCLGKAAAFDASNSSSPDGAVLSYHWDFGDGTSSDEKVTSHTYEKPGSYRVVLTVKDSSGSECSMSSDSFVAVVNAQPEAVIEVR